MVTYYSSPKFIIITSLHFRIIIPPHINFTSLFMQDSPDHSLCPLSIPASVPLKKKYSKVNEALRVRFIEFIVQKNMSIKEVHSL